jgi:D-lactate dehydrogenase
MKQCCLAVTALKKSPVAALELIDSRSLAAVVGKPAMPLSKAQVAELVIDAAALLVETRSVLPEELDENIEQLLAVLEPFQTAVPAKFSNEPAIIEELY